MTKPCEVAILPHLHIVLEKGYISLYHINAISPNFQLTKKRRHGCPNSMDPRTARLICFLKLSKSSRMSLQMGIDNCGIQVDTEGRGLSFGFSNGMKTMEPGLSNPIGGML